SALHWAAKHGNEDVVKLIAGAHKADVNGRTGYTPLHIAMQFGRANIFALLCNTYKANRDLLDWAGNKALDYSKQQTSVSASTYSKIKAKKKPTVEKDSGFLRIGSLNVRVKKTTEAFSNFLGVGNGNTMPHTTNHLPHRHQRHHHHPHHLLHVGSTRNPHHLHPMMKAHMKKSATMVMTKTPSSLNNQLGSRASVSINPTKYDMLHKSWGSADNITQASGTNGIGNEDEDLMPPPKGITKRQKSIKRSSVASSTTTNSPRDSISSTSSSNLNSGYSSMPTTPNQLRSSLGLGAASALPDSDSDSACGFDSNWSIGGRKNSSSNSNLKSPRFP
uniref:ANK_REP_REGION domain-containing protein n=1 Tax=Glossina brevipalpis TaxID=37001 RepID=A0A1A9WD45_9MUSC